MQALLHARNGTWTDLVGKYCLRRLAVWDGFLDEQRAALGKVIAFLPNTLELFESRDLAQSTGGRLAAGSPIGSERDLELFHHSAVELPVQLIIDQLVHAQQGSDAIPPLTDIGDGVFFENHMNVLNSDTSPSPSPAPSTLPPHALPVRKKAPIQPDQICVYRSSNGDQTLAYVLEYKAPHKLTAHQVREGINPLDVVRDVVNCATIPVAEGDRFRHFAKRLSVAAATQVYHYMLQTGLKMGLVATGEVSIFFKIDWADPSTLYYHVAAPTPECRDQPAEFLPYCTAVSQLLAFIVMALLGPTPQGQDASDRATASAPTWKEDWGMILAQRQDPSDIDDDDDDDDYAGHNNPGYRPSSTGRAGSKRKRGTAQPSGAGSAAAAPGDTQTQNRTHSSQPQTPPFCTHACLLGLVRGGALDPACPNAALRCRPHVKSSPCIQSSSSLPPRCQKTHPLPLRVFLERLRQQLCTTLDEGIMPLGRHGARGALFCITLLSHGYTFAAKGTTSSSVRFIEHEARVYEQLQPIRGLYVPVSLGTIDLEELGRRYFYAADVHIIYFPLLSWAGRDLFEAREQTGGVGMQDNVLQSLRSLHALGVAHGDVRRENLVWSHMPSDPVMIIDFERSVPTKAPCRLGLLKGSEDGDKKLFEQDFRTATEIFQA
ncbi:hypothetical protein B0H67DRAFT_647972 [Lasiosphaeris hirsuta]|uniref:Protein kinase domain-containing protein n=1 Tax=Lasiosphaeris hirsuta TaxID=260670 RepID=A0AA40A1Y7_9PEZI|nr:hypothetical protein B0H67DRAFT_647972 [Lasiosphaeris hirsuta]